MQQWSIIESSFPCNHGAEKKMSCQGQNMKPTNCVCVISLVILFATYFLSQTAEAEFVLQTLCEFPATLAPNTNAPPQEPGGMVEASDGSFYGAAAGGSNYYVGPGFYLGNGTIFRVTKTGAMTRIFSFNGTIGNGPSGGVIGKGPSGGLIFGNDGCLYGVTASGGTKYQGAGGPSYNQGTIFKITTNGVLTSLFSLFNGTNGCIPVGRLALGDDGNFYGTTQFGGNGFPGQSLPSGNGTIFKCSTNGDFNVLYYFNGTNGSVLYAGLTLGDDGNFYGATTYGGSNYSGQALSGYGTLFQINTNGNLTTLAYFNGTNGSQPMAGLTQGPDKNFYGTTQTGGAFNLGTVFQITTNGILTTLLSFDGTNGGNPASSLTFGSDGNLYGSTPWIGVNDNTHYGTLFRITTNGLLTTLVSLNGTNGLHAYTDMILGSDGNLYGSMVDKRAAQLPDGSLGSIFRLVQPPTLSSISPTNGGMTITWDSFTNAVYRVECKANLVSTNWTALVTNVVTTSNSVIFTDSSLISTQRFYRVRLLP